MKASWVVEGFIWYLVEYVYCWSKAFASMTLPNGLQVAKRRGSVREAFYLDQGKDLKIIFRNICLPLRDIEAGILSTTSGRAEARQTRTNNMYLTINASWC